MTPTVVSNDQPGNCADCGEPVNPPGLKWCRPCAAVHDPDTPEPWRHIHINLFCEDCGAPRTEFHWQCWSCAVKDIKG
jgi:hypothetical protein